MDAMNPLSAGNAADAWDVLDRLVDDVAHLSRSGVARQAFYHELLRRAVDALAALGGAAWDSSTDQPVRHAFFTTADSGGDWVLPANDVRSESLHRQLLEWVKQRGEPVDVGPRAVVDRAADVTNPYDAALILAPIIVDGATLGVLELFQRPAVGADARQGALRVLAALADCAADYQRESQRRLWQDKAASAADFERLVGALYDELDSTTVAYAAANEGRRWIAVDRVSVVVCDGDAARTLAVSGVDLVDRRSDSIRLLERLAAVVVRGREPLWHTARSEPPQMPLVADALRHYVDHSDAATVVVLPLAESESADGAASSQSAVGAIVVERFSEAAEPDDAWKARLETLALHTGRALRRAAECESIPLGRWWRGHYRRRSRIERKRMRFAVYAALAAAVVGAPFLIPAEAKVEARGSLEPAQRRDLFAPSDGIVAEVNVRHGQAVVADQPLIVLRRPELTVDLTRVSGELQAAERRLAALRAARTVENPGNAAARVQAQERSAEEEQLKETVRALGDEQRLLLDQVRDLTIRAPFAGIVTTWDVERSLPGRPVARGQSLLSLADDAGSWVVELLVPDRYAGDVLTARRERSEPLEVDFVAATHPETVYRGRVVRIAEATETDPTLGVVVRTTVAVDRNAIAAEQLRPGAAVTARILCGPSSLGAVYGRDAGRFIRSLWW